MAFTIGPFSVQWYGLGYIFGFLLAALLAKHIAKLWKIELTWDALLTVLIAVMIGTVLGGRLGFILFYGQGYYFEHPEKIFAFPISGMSFHGGMIGLGIGLAIAARVLKMPLLTLGDIGSITCTIGLGLVRVANFINGELWGSVTDLPWGVVFENGGPLPRHPTQLYEAFLEGVVLLVLLYLLARRRPPLPRGSYFSIFLIGYGVFRIAVEFIRQPDVQLGYLLGTDWVTMGMLLSLPMVIGGVILLMISLKRQEPQIGLEWLGDGLRASESDEMDDTDDYDAHEHDTDDYDTDDYDAHEHGPLDAVGSNLHKHEPLDAVDEEADKYESPDIDEIKQA